MIIENPVLQDVPALRALWKQAFSDTDSFLDSFFSLAFSPERAMVARQEGKIVGEGKHEELLKTCNVYKEIALSQLSKEEL